MTPKHLAILHLYPRIVWSVLWVWVCGFPPYYFATVCPSHTSSVRCCRRSSCGTLLCLMLPSLLLSQWRTYLPPYYVHGHLQFTESHESKTRTYESVSVTQALLSVPRGKETGPSWCLNFIYCMLLSLLLQEISPEKKHRNATRSRLLQNQSFPGNQGNQTTKITRS